WTIGMAAEKVAGAAPDHDEVWLRLRLVIQRDRILDADDPAWPKDRGQRSQRQAHGHCVRAALRLGDDKLARDQLDGIVLAEDTHVEQPPVLRPGPPPPASNRITHHEARLAALPR